MRLTPIVRFTAPLVFLLAALAVPVRAHAQGGCISGSSGCTSTPEIDPSTIGEGGALLAGVALLLRTRKKS